MGRNNLYAECMRKSGGLMFDFAVNSCGLNGDRFWEMFICSGVAEQMENKNPKYAAGKSGVELVFDITDSVGIELEIREHRSEGRSREYWCGWALLQYQIYSGMSFKAIHSIVKFSDLQNMYVTLHEADITKFFDTIDRLKEGAESSLKIQRQRIGWSQSRLAGNSGVNLRTIQAYEQRLKDINQGKYDILYKLAEGLGCNIKDILN